MIKFYEMSLRWSIIAMLLIGIILGKEFTLSYGIILISNCMAIAGLFTIIIYNRIYEKMVNYLKTLVVEFDVMELKLKLQKLKEGDKVLIKSLPRTNEIKHLALINTEQIVSRVIHDSYGTSINIHGFPLILNPSHFDIIDAETK